MPGRSSFFVVIVLLLVTGGAARATNEVKLVATDRILVLAPHPDDEVVGCAGVLQEAKTLGLPVRVVFLTYGDNNEWSFFVYRKHPVFLPGSVRRLGETRRLEALAADQVLGVNSNQISFLGYPDYGTLAIWYSHWGRRPPFRSMLTRVRAVPYATALRPGAPYKGEEVLRDLTAVIRDFKPTKLFVSHAADHNQDHRALYLFTRIALWDLAGEVQPEIYPYLVHFARWPKPRGIRLSQALTPPAGLNDRLVWQTLPLGQMQTDRKLDALKQHRSQWKVSRGYLGSFVRANELFGDFPSVVLRPPATGHAKSHFNLADAPADHEAPEQLTDEERAAFVGMEWRNARLDGDALVVTVELSRPLGNAVKVSLYAFGYRPDKPFADMPKIQVRVAEDDVDGFDQNRRLRTEGITVAHGARQISTRIPLAVLGHPTRILTSARTYLADVPLDWVSWRILELPAP